LLHRWSSGGPAEEMRFESDELFAESSPTGTPSLAPNLIPRSPRTNPADPGFPRLTTLNLRPALKITRALSSAGPPLIQRSRSNGPIAGPLVSFARSGVAAHWKASAYQSILELAEACDVPVRWSCRTGVCHSCESSLVSGAVVYAPDPLDQPAEGNVLVCCSQPVGDVVIDL
jgi:ferredoxin